LIFRLLKLESRHLCFGIAALVVSSCTNLALPTIVGHVVDLVSGRSAISITATSNRNSIGTQTFIMGALASFSLGAMASFARVYYFGVAQIGIANHMRKLLFSRMIEQTSGHVNDHQQDDKEQKDENIGVGPLIACLGQVRVLFAMSKRERETAIWFWLDLFIGTFVLK
jgi:ABC-type multidrug transport system fused ATPase/permease subunit